MMNKNNLKPFRFLCVWGVIIAASVSVLLGCDLLADKIWTDYIWKVDRGYYNVNSLNTGLPIIRIDTENGQTIKSKQNYINAVIAIDSPNDSHDLQATQTEVRGRGNTTWWYPKRPYRVKLNSKTSLFGLTQAKSWVLLANHQDPTLMMNRIAFKLGDIMSFPFTNHSFAVELVLNGVYEGSYVLTEQVQAGSGRVDIKEPKEADAKTDFLVELDSYYDEEPKFTSTHYHLPVMIKSPEDYINTANYNFVKDAVNDLDSRLYEGKFTGSGNYKELINLDSFVKFLLINEIVGNKEVGFPKSAYMYKNSKTGGGQIFMGPLWDFDSGFSYQGEGLNVYFKDSRYLINHHPFFKRLFDDPDFTAAYKAAWNTYKSQITSDLFTFIDDTAFELEKSQKANFTVWKWLNKPNYGNEVSKLKRWLQDRIVYLNGEIDK
jgi:hypothetical protein